jgi:drug/metabolite transporter (DMT)-like permease
MLGGSYPLTEVGLHAFDPLTLVWFRLLIGSVFLAGWLVAHHQPLPRGRRVRLLLVGVGLVNSLGSFFLVTWGQKYVSSAYTSILAGSQPIFVAVGATFLLPAERLTLRRALAVGVGFGGVVCLFANELGWGGSGGGQHALIGALAILAGAAALAVVALTVRVALPEYAPAQVALPMLVTGLIVIGPVVGVLALKGSRILKFEPQHLGPLAAMFALGILNAGVGNLIWYTLLRHWGATRTALVLYVVPLVGVGLGVLLLHNRLGLNMLLGLVLITGSLLAVNPPLRRRAGAPGAATSFEG